MVLLIIHLVTLLLLAFTWFSFNFFFSLAFSCSSHSRLTLLPFSSLFSSSLFASRPPPVRPLLSCLVYIFLLLIFTFLFVLSGVHVDIFLTSSTSFTPLVPHLPTSVSELIVLLFILRSPLLLPISYSFFASSSSSFHNLSPPNIHYLLIPPLFLPPTFPPYRHPSTPPHPLSSSSFRSFLTTSYSEAPAPVPPPLPPFSRLVSSRRAPVAAATDTLPDN